MADQKYAQALHAYSHVGEICSCEPYGNGHINDTFLVVTKTKKYVLQRMNDTAFPSPELVMKNVCKITEHIKRKAEASGSDPLRATLTVVKTDTGDASFLDVDGSFWRMLEFVSGTVCKERVQGREDFRSCGFAFGDFQYKLSDFPVEELNETIVDFHNTPVRYGNLIRAVKENRAGRAAGVAAEIKFAMEREHLAYALENARKSGKIPFRVTHNDTKLNNVLFDSEGKECVCVIDLDTVMPGYSVNDFGDSIRFGANTADEDEADLSAVSLDLDLFEAYAEGFLCGCRGILTKGETELLPVGALVMTYECGMRFLTDYLDGDVYFRTRRDGHNLDRCRNQFRLLLDMENKLDLMYRAIKRAQEKATSLLT